MDAETMKLAMEQMRKMNPAQLQEMMRNMPPDAVNQAMAQMKDMKADDWERAKQQMASMDPETLSRQAAQAQAQMAGRTQYVLNASNQLKAEGNQLHGRGAYQEAVEKYERAKSNVESFTSKEARDLARACTLNLSSCYLNLKQYAKCLEQCDSVLSGEPDNLKALYRRGQAYLGSGDCVNAAADLERALKLSLQTDPSQAQPIRDKLQEAKDQIGALRAAGKLPPASAATSAESKPSKASEAASAERALAASAPASGSGAVSGRKRRAGPDQEIMSQAARMMQMDSDRWKQVHDVVRGMSDEELRGLAKRVGMEATPEAPRGGLGKRDMDNEMLEIMVKLQAELPADLRNSDAAKNPESMKRLADLMAQKPELASTMGKLLSSMDPDELQEMSRAAGLPSGMKITPELAKAATESFQRMSPQEVKDAVQLVSKMRSSVAAPSSSSAAGGAAGRQGEASTSGREAVPPMAGMPPMDPGAAAEMLAAMTPEQLESMSKMVPGMDRMQLTPEMAKMAAEMVKGMTAEDMARMQEMVSKMQGASSAAPTPAGASGGGSAAPAAVAAAGGFPPDMAAAAADMMKNMTPEDMARMQEMATKMGMGPGGLSGLGSGGPAGGLGGLGAGGSKDPMAAMLNDPKMMESAVRMMKSMDPEALASMMMSSGMCKDRAQAEAMARQMSNLTDAQLNMMVKTASALQNARMAGTRLLEWARSNVLLVLAIFVLVLALLLRWLGYM